MNKRADMNDMGKHIDMNDKGRLIDLNDFVLFGGGFMGESYNHKQNPDIMLKLYPLNWTWMAVKEHERAMQAYALGIPTPEPGDLVRVQDGRKGILFRRIPGKKSFARAVGEDPSQTEAFALLFADMCKRLHSTRVDTNEIPSVKDHYAGVIQEHPYLTTVQQDKVLRFIADAPETDTALHGDLHFGNVIFRGDERWFIDIGEFSYGSPYFDLAVSMMTMKYSPEERIRELYHMDKRTSIRFLEAFLAAYFGPGCSLKDIEEELERYVVLRTLMIQRDLGFIIPERQPLVDAFFAE